MATHDLNILSLPDLKKLQRDIAKAIETYDHRQKATALSVLEEKAKEFGYTLADLFANVIGKSKTKKPIDAKYANPADASVTWSGRGRRPRWFLEAVAAGKTPESLEL